ncbi:biopolymer transporter ExbD [Saccharobesus litoralis]|uniref:Biopolymer transporter ExbD n=1 Tax=Saccharobesus litoralis TaxID=2172099 RepID=A0A2S0VT26_9ALTE|nr:biopolymer transporter ExbD [Saccharobesus litoralis]AWB67364.1 biopolymer transporter ExbD [Saccharobesus litoralis]
MRRLRRPNQQEAELDITSFMNLMIVLVPVLLLSLVFSQVRILNLQLPVAASGDSQQEEQDEPKLLELIIDKSGFELHYPSGVLLKQIDKTEQGYDFVALKTFLKDLKMTFQQNNIEKNDIVLLLAPNTDYQTIVTAMDTVRSFEAVVAANLVDAELFPNISLGDAPVAEVATTTEQGGQ